VEQLNAPCGGDIEATEGTGKGKQHFSFWVPPLPQSPLQPRDSETSCLAANAPQPVVYVTKTMPMPEP
jgi:hypothetical protein